MRLVLALLAVLAAVGTAHAGGEVGVVASGDSDLPDQVRAHFQTWLLDHGHTVAARPLSRDAINTLANCFTLDDLACARGVVDARAKTEKLIYVGVARTGNNITFNVYWFVKGKEAVGERRVCEKCEGTAWHGLTDKMLERLVGDLAIPVKPGSRTGPVIAMGAGVGLMTAGLVFLWYGSRDGSNQKFIYPESTPVGIALGTVGAGATLAGFIWFSQTGSTSRPVASATRDGAFLGWTGHF